MSKAIDLTGQRFGRLTVLERASDYITPKGVRRVRWKCLCNCGNEYITKANSLLRNEAKSCGCLRSERSAESITSYNAIRMTHPSLKHGRTVNKKIERLYKVWSSMRSRCYGRNQNQYHNYGGRGITICDEWQDYEKFREWAMANGYDENAPRGQCTIDRIDVNGNYCPENCRWVSAKVQVNNKRNSRFIEYEGSTYTVTQLAEKLKLPYITVIKRLNKGYYKEVKKCQD